ncbi:MAG: acyl-CoA dehydrogenase [Halieaceae bacterium]|jgi:alkylation response protein AidB-like acyl-CoA dehydrogenase|nr:acyl-CoA dehydrogenase [Halieaceae bacterium]MBT5208106.1 acyl-CoA dehydrogenase [Halieaceae bacterium]MBT5888643.1 acyl-CoA dehydrogenase [Halieaceae bacterium]MBT7340047.1 acyl-CoA dehydrogenase [Halieaceae bacterium]
MSNITRESSPEALQSTVNDWLDAHWDTENRRPVNAAQYDERSWYKQVLDAGYCVPSWSTKWFGLGLTMQQGAMIERTFRARKAPGAGRDRYHLGAITLSKMGNAELKREMLPELLTGPVCCLLYSEPNAGSDLAGVRTKADQDGDSFVINGQKVWTSDAVSADYGMLLARTDWDVPKHQGVTFFLFPMKQPGVEIRPINQITGESEFNEVFITDARVPERFVIGELNEGWRSFQTAIAYERLIMGQGITERKRGAANEGVHPLIALANKAGRLHDPVFRQRIAQALAYREVNRLTNERAKNEMQSTGAATLMSLGKLAMSRIQHGEAAIATDLLGAESILDGEGAMDAANANFDAAKAYMNSIGGGTDQIQRNIIAEKVLQLPKEPDANKGLAFREVKSSSGPV